MSRKLQHLNPNRYFHIYNRGNNSIPIFPDAASVHYFFKKYDQYIGPVADTLAWCLLPNQFHFIVYLKDLTENQFELKYRTVTKPKRLTHWLQFSHFFNAYTQAVNKKFSRTGALFEKPFGRHEIASVEELQKKIISMHNYSRAHFALKSSCDEITGRKTARLNLIMLYQLFGSEKNFKTAHSIFLTWDDFATFTKH